MRWIEHRPGRGLRVGQAALLVCLLSGAAISHAVAARMPESDNPLHSVLDRTVDTESVRFFGSGCHVGLSIVVVRPESTYFYDYGSALLQLMPIVAADEDLGIESLQRAASRLKALSPRKSSALPQR
jgi:hypothetical protein